MSSEHVERRLAAILAADVVGSCRLIEINEEGSRDWKKDCAAPGCPNDHALPDARPWQRGDRKRHFRCWHFSDVLRQSSDVRCWGVNRPKLAAPEGRLLTQNGIPSGRR